VRGGVWLLRSWLREGTTSKPRGGLGAVTHAVKASATREGKELRSHRDLWIHVDEFSERLSDREIRLLWRTANSLHQDFYENWVPSRDVRYAVEDIKRLIEELKGLINLNQSS
jgi:xylose isomerase